jgi:hypothetical protein
MVEFSVINRPYSINCVVNRGQVYNQRHGGSMYVLRPDEKTTPVMLYARDTLVRGEAVSKQNVQRVNIWLRSDGAPKYMHILKPQVIVFGGTPVRPLSFSEIFFPTSQLIAFHTLPPTDEPLDYDPNEANRVMQDVQVLVGTFVVRGRSASRPRRNFPPAWRWRVLHGYLSTKQRSPTPTCPRCLPCGCRWCWSNRRRLPSGCYSK